MVTICSIGQPNAIVFCRRAYWRAADSVFVSTCRSVDCRTYRYAVRDKCALVTFDALAAVVIASHRPASAPSAMAASTETISSAASASTGRPARTSAGAGAATGAAARTRSHAATPRRSTAANRRHRPAAPAPAVVRSLRHHCPPPCRCSPSPSVRRLFGVLSARASARSTDRGCTTMANRSRIAAASAAEFSDASSARRARANATTSSVTLCTPRGPGLAGTRPRNPSRSNAAAVTGGVISTLVPRPANGLSRSAQRPDPAPLNRSGCRRARVPSARDLAVVVMMRRRVEPTC
jgi:hypothetical protein